MTEFARLTAQFELSGFPEGLDALYDQYAVDYQPHALMRPWADRRAVRPL